jgi:hypothetical protein
MVTDRGMLNRSEKLEIEKLIKCKRERKRQKLFEKLDAKRKLVEEPFNKEISLLEDKIKDVENKRFAAVVKAGYGKIRERGCFDTHEELDKFDEETNNELQKLWERQT